MSIPPAISEALLPQDDLNVVDFIDFVIPLGEHTPDLLAMDDSTLFSKIGSLITNKEHVSFLHSLSIPTAGDVEVLQERLEKLSNNEAMPVQERPKSLVYPLPTPHDFSEYSAAIMDPQLLEQGPHHSQAEGHLEACNCMVKIEKEPRNNQRT